MVSGLKQAAILLYIKQQIYVDDNCCLLDFGGLRRAA